MSPGGEIAAGENHSSTRVTVSHPALPETGRVPHVNRRLHPSPPALAPTPRGLCCHCPSLPVRKRRPRAVTPPARPRGAAGRRRTPAPGGSRALRTPRSAPPSLCALVRVPGVPWNRRPPSILPVAFVGRYLNSFTFSHHD